MSGSLSFGTSAGRARPARSLRSRHDARHAAPHGPAPLRRGRLVRRPPMLDAGSDAAGRPRPRAVRRALRRRLSPRRAAPSPRLGEDRRCSAARSSSAPATSTPARRCGKRGIDPRTRSDRISRPARRSSRRGDPRDPGARGRARRLDLAQLPQRRRRERRIPAQGQGLRSRRQAVPSLRHAGAPHRPGSARDLLLPRLPTTLSSNARLPGVRNGRLAV